MKMKLLIYTPVFYPSVGGLETMNLLLATEFSNHGYEVGLMTPIPCNERIDVNFTVVRATDNATLWKYYKWCDVFFHSALVLKKAWPVFVRPKKWVIAHHSCSFNWNQKRDFSSFLKWFLSNLAHNIVVSNAVGRKLKLCRKYSVIYNAYDNHTFKLSNYSPRRDFVFVGRLSREKGADLLIKAFAMYYNKSQYHFHLTIIGDGAELRKLQELARQHNMEPYIHFKGVMRGEALVNELNRHSCLIMPSSCYEAFGIVVLEALACGCYVLGSDGDGIQEAMGVCGTTFKKKSEEDLSMNLLKYEKQDAESFQNHIEKASAYVSHFSPQIVAKKYMDYFAGLSGSLD